MCAPSKPCLEKGPSPKAIETKVLESELQKLLACSSHLQVHATAGLKLLYRRKKRAGSVPPTPTPVPLAKAMQEVKQADAVAAKTKESSDTEKLPTTDAKEVPPTPTPVPLAKAMQEVKQAAKVSLQANAWRRNNFEEMCPRPEPCLEKGTSPKGGGNAKVLESELQKLLACSNHFKVHATAGLKLLQRRKQRAEAIALCTRQPEVIRQQMEVAKDLNKVGEGPSSKAILQAEEKDLNQSNAWQRRISDPATVQLTLAEACAKADEAKADEERPVMGLMMRREAKGSLLLDVEGDAEAKKFFCTGTVWPDSILNLFRQAGQPSKASTDMAVGAGMKSLMLYCGAAERPDPLKAATGGEDAYFICPNGSAAGVADGVGSNRKWKIDPALFPKELMEGAKEAIAGRLLEDKTPIQDRVRHALGDGFQATTKFGSATALVAALDPCEAKLGVANLGDSGLRVLRWKKPQGVHVVLRTEEMQHGWNTPKQLARMCPAQIEHAKREGITIHEDTAKDCLCYSVEVQEGDVVLLGTDGIFDNLHDREVCDLATLAMEGGCRINPQRLAEAFAEAARVR